MSSSRRVLAVCHDAGGARALMPVAEELVRRGASVEACVAGPAASIWPRECSSVKSQEVADDLGESEARARLQRQGVDTLFSASGLYNQVEHTFRVAARALAARTVAVLDSWLNYAERFERCSNGRVVRSHPDLVCVIDELSYQGMLAAGFSPEQLVVTGPPNLEASVRLCSAVDAAQRAAWRAEDGLTAEGLVVTFFSEPFVTGPNGQHFEGPGALIGHDGGSLFGYTALDTLDAVLHELEAACREARRPCTVIVRPHPAECADPLRSLLAARRTRWVDAVVRGDRNASRWIAVADVVVGMMTIALLEAALAGRPTLSVQLGLREARAEDPCLGNRLGYTYPIYDRAELGLAMRRACRDAMEPRPGLPGRELPIWGAVERVASAVLDSALATRVG